MNVTPLACVFFCLDHRKQQASRAAMVALGVSNLCFMLPWQFAQFVLLTQVGPDHALQLALPGSAPGLLPVSLPLFQVASLFASYILGYLAATKMQSILATHMVR